MRVEIKKKKEKWKNYPEGPFTCMNLLDTPRWGCQEIHPYSLRNLYQSRNKILQQLIQIYSLQLQVIYSVSTLLSYEKMTPETTAVHRGFVKLQIFDK